MSEIINTADADRLLSATKGCAIKFRHEFIMPEHMLYVLIDDLEFGLVLSAVSPRNSLKPRVAQYLNSLETVPPATTDYEPQSSAQMTMLLANACEQVISSEAPALDVPHLVMGLLRLDESWACYLLRTAIGNDTEDFMSELLSYYGIDEPFFDEEDEEDEEDDLFEDDDLFPHERQSSWRKLVTLMNEQTDGRNPLIGREQELERTIQVLCRREKNNPLHVGESGVGKTALVWGLVDRIVRGRVPERLKGAHVFMLDMGTLVAGSNYRGDFENRIKLIMEGVMADGSNNIVYIDEIHNVVGAGATSESSLDASNMLKPYLESGSIRFIGSTTYEEYNRYFSKSKGLVRRFQQIDIMEPSIAETVNILKQLRPHYEQFHGVVYEDAALQFAVEASAKFINDRFLPDKALDLIDEAGAALEVGGAKVRVVSKQLIADVLAKTCKVDALALSDHANEQLETLSERLKAQVYGQDEAIAQVVSAVQMSKAGLTDDDKPVASLLFVGPTGVGKTEVARQLAQQMGIELVRFDMSEYTEKHAVAKLIGSPAGYVGYEDGGLLTDAIRKTPNCVLLLDEIEKAHQDIYNILLQVMDYARLTDNKGRKADFRGVVLIMTSNAGAQFAAQASIGFAGGVTRGEAMMRQVKKTFKPEFINRLSATVVFHDMDRGMATLILRKKLRQLEDRLRSRNVRLTLKPAAFDLLLSQGFTPEYGAREMDRVIAQQLKSLLVREMLFGRLKKGGAVTIGCRDARLVIGPSRGR